MSLPRPSSIPSPARALLCVLLLLAGCGKKDKTTEPENPGGGASQLVAQANAKLADVLFAQLNGPDPTRPSDIDLREPYALYQQALAAEPGNRDANFGVGVLGLLSLTYDSEVNAAFDEWQAYLQSHTPFQARAGHARPLGVPLRFGDGGSALRLPFELVPFSSVARIRAPLGAPDPEIGRIQSILRERAIPRLSEAIVRLHAAASGPYQFWVTPRMQGDEGADSLEIDQTDVLALAAACGLLASACHVAVAYDLGFAGYDSLSLHQAVQPGSPWLALENDGAAHMGSAGTSLSGALGDLDAAVASLRAETDPQDNDVIRRGPADVTVAQLDSLHRYIGVALQSLGTGFTLTEDWDDDPMTPEVPLTIRVGQMFQNPVPNWKQALPGYTASVVRRPYQVQYVNDFGTRNLTATAPGIGYFSFSYSIDDRSYTTPVTQEYGDAFLGPGVRHLVDSLYAAVAARPDWAGDFYGSADAAGFAPSAGTHDFSLNWYLFYTQTVSEVFVPVIHWNAATFDDWVWPDPTLHGLLPDIASSDQLLAMFGIDGAGWTQEVVLDWTGNAAPRARAGLPRIASAPARAPGARVAAPGSLARVRSRR